MATYVQHRLRAFKSLGDPSGLPSNVSSIFRLKSYNSATDPRAWATSSIDRKQYILDVFTSDHVADAFPGRYVKGQALLETLLSNKNADIEYLQQQLVLTEQFLDELGITSAQRELLRRKRSQSAMKGHEGQSTHQSERSDGNFKSHVNKSGLTDFAHCTLQKMTTYHATIGNHRLKHNLKHFRSSDLVQAKRSSNDSLCRRRSRFVNLRSHHDLFTIRPIKLGMRNSCSQTEILDVIKLMMNGGDNTQFLSGNHENRSDISDKAIQYMQDTFNSICAQTSENKLQPHAELQQLRNQYDVRQLECDRYKLKIAELLAMRKDYEGLRKVHAQLQKESREREEQQQMRIVELEDECAELKHAKYAHVDEQVERLQKLMKSQREQIWRLEQTALSRPQRANVCVDTLVTALDQKTAQLRSMEEKMLSADVQYKNKIRLHTDKVDQLRSTLDEVRAKCDGLNEEKREFLLGEQNLLQRINDKEVEIVRLEEDNRVLRERESRVEALRAKVLEIQKDNERFYQMNDKIKEYVNKMPQMSEKESQCMEEQDGKEADGRKQIACIHRALAELEANLDTAIERKEDKDATSTLGILQCKYKDIQRIIKDQMNIFAHGLHRCRGLLRQMESDCLKAS